MTSPQVSSSPISLLPHELLNYIFLICKFDTDRIPPYYRTLITASQVCHRWRVVAIGCPHLWADINVEYPCWVEEKLRRSQDALIHIHSYFDEPTLHQVIAFRKAILEVHRVKALTLMAPEATLETLLDVLPDVAPHLEYLEFTPASKSYHNHIHYSHLIPVLDGSVLGANQGTTHMRHIDLVGCQINWGSPLLCGLSHLSLSELKFNTTLLQFIDVLRSCPMLEYLSICNFDSSDEDTKALETPLHHVAELPCLTSLEFRDAFDLITTALLMERLILSSNCTIQIKQPGRLNLEENESEVYLKKILASITTPKSVLNEDLTASLYSTAQMNISSYLSRLRLSQAHLPISDSEIQSSPYVELDDIEDIGTKQNTIRILTEALSLPHLKTFFANTSSRMTEFFSLDASRFFWTTLLPHLPNVTHVEIGGISAITFLEILLNLDTEYKVAGNGRPNPGVCLPRLEKVGLRFVTFWKSIHSSAISTNDLCYSLIWLCSYRPNFRQVSFTNCLNLTVDNIQPLARVVKVCLNGQEIH